MVDIPLIRACLRNQGWILIYPALIVLPDKEEGHWESNCRICIDVPIFFFYHIGRCSGYLKVRWLILIGDLKELTWVFARIIFFLHELIPGYSCIWWRNMRK